MSSPDWQNTHRPNTVLLIGHGDSPPDDRINSYLHLNGYHPVTVQPFAGESLEPWFARAEGAARLAGCVIHGGPFNAFDTKLHPFLKDEYKMLQLCLDHSIPLLGICQGAQQLALQLGANVGPLEGEPCEFGYYPILPIVDSAESHRFLPDPLVVTQAHFHSFELPRDAVHLARSEQFENQAFRWGENAYGLQFHAEVTIEGFRRWQKLFTHFAQRPGAQDTDTQTRLMLEHDHEQASWFYGFLESVWPKTTAGEGLGSKAG